MGKYNSRIKALLIVIGCLWGGILNGTSFIALSLLLILGQKKFLALCRIPHIVTPMLILIILFGVSWGCHWIKKEFFDENKITWNIFIYEVAKTFVLLMLLSLFFNQRYFENTNMLVILVLVSLLSGLAKTISAAKISNPCEKETR